ncbi:hypothetical protein ACWDYH_20240 [Nocardia goodfellowii]
MSWWDIPANPCGPYRIVRPSADPDRQCRAPEALRRTAPFLADAVDRFEHAAARPWAFTERPQGIPARARAEWAQLRTAEQQSLPVERNAAVAALADRVTAGAPIKERDIHGQSAIMPARDVSSRGSGSVQARDRRRTR